MSETETIKIEADETAKPDARSKAKFILEAVITIACMFLVVWLVRTFVISPYSIPSGSMEDTLMTGDYVLAEKVSYELGTPQQGDIVTFADPEDGSKTLIKRVIAVGGQTVDLRDGHVYVDGEELDEPYTEGKPSYAFDANYHMPGVEVEFPYTVPQGEMWMMGDNRTNSKDSRYFGAVPVSSAAARAVCIYWPVADLKALS